MTSAVSNFVYDSAPCLKEQWHLANLHNQRTKLSNLN